MNRWTSLRAIACAPLLSIPVLSSPAAAQQITRIIVLGDSYADTGNALRLAGISPASTGVYTTGRFSGGTNYIDTLSAILGVPQYNFAIGGARTDNGNQNAGLPGLTFEVQQFLAGGGALGFPTVSTTLARSDLVAVSIGGNDARAYQLTGGSLAGAPAAAAVAVTNAANNLNLVVARGTPTISFLAGDTGRLPEIGASPTGAAIRTAYSNAFNTGVQSVLAGYAQKGSIVHYLDLNQVLNQIGANPTAYGITNGLNCPFFPANTTCAVNASGYLFYGDGLHLTSQGFAIVGQYVARQLAAPLTLEAPTNLGFDVARQWGRTLSTRSDLYGRSDAAPGLRLYVLGDAVSHDARSTNFNNAYEVRSTGASVGAEYGIAGGTIGIAGNYGRPKLTFNNDSAWIRGRTWQIGAYGSLSSGGLFGQAYAGYGKDRDRIARQGVVQGMLAEPRGHHTVAGAKAGYLMPFSVFQVGPIIQVDYARARVNGYTETGDPALTLSVSNQSRKAFTGQAGVEVRGELAGLHPYVDVTAERNLSGNGGVITFAQTSAPTIVNSWALPSRKQTYARVSGGASANLTSGISIDAAMSTTIGRDDGPEVGGQLGLKARF